MKTGPMQPIEFFFDFASPYAYLASARIDDLGRRHGRLVLWRPILLGAVFKVTGMKPSMLMPMRDEYLRHDVARCARAAGLPLVWPDAMPLNSLIPARVFHWLEMTERSDLARTLAIDVFRAHWGRGEAPETVEAVADLSTAHGLNPGEIDQACRSAPVKDRLRAVVDDAISRGVFGSPFFLVEGEPFWGADRLADLDRWLATGGW